MNASKIAKKIELLLTNAYLNSLINKYLLTAINTDEMDIEYATENEIIIIKKSNEDFFHLVTTAENNTTINLTTANEEVKIKISFDEENNRIIFEREIITPNKTKTIKEKRIEKRIYIDNKLRYDYIYTSFEDLYLDNSEYITVSETYIDLNNQAVIQKMTLSGDKRKKKDIALNYFELESLLCAPFNNLVNSIQSKSSELIPSTREVFNDFINGGNNISPIL